MHPPVGLYSNVGIALARRGIGVAVINYRLVPSVTFDEQYADVAHSIAWVQANITNRRGDPAHVVLAGHSAGGHIAASTSQRSAATRRSHRSSISPPSPAPTRRERRDRRNGVRQRRRAQLAAHVAPMLILLGDRDLAALQDQVPPAVDELVALGAPVEFATLAGKDHDHVVLDFDSDADAMTPLLVHFVTRVAP